MKKKFIIAVVILFVIMLLLPRQNIKQVNLSNAFAPLSREHYFGTDNLGRDIFSLIVEGFIRTITVVIVASGISITLGTLLGMLGGYYEGNIGIFVQFLTDIFLIVPSFIVALIITAIFGLNPVTAGVTIGISQIGSYGNQAYILTRDFKNREFIKVEKVLGISNGRIFLKHILPNIITPILTTFSNNAGGIILQFASLSFIGLGSDITTPDWGTMLFAYRIYINNRPILVLWPTLAIFLVAITFHILFDNREIGGAKRSNLYE